MIPLPPLPAWQAMHPLIVHFPIALLLIAPVFVIIGAVQVNERGRSFLAAALILMVLGTAGTFVAQSSGEAASKAAAQTPAIHTVVENHEELAETTSIVFSVLTVIFAGIVWGPKLTRWAGTRVVTTALPLVFLLFYSAGAVLLINTAHNGGRLVHELGISSPMTQPPQAASNSSMHTEDDD